MKTRILSGLAMLPLAAVFYFRGVVLYIAVLIIGIMAIRELIKAFENVQIRGSFVIAFASFAALMCSGCNFILKEQKAYYILAWIFVTVLASFLYLFNIEKRKLEDALVTVFASMYVGLFAYHIILLDENFKEPFIWLIPFVAFGTDIFAYFVGVSMGKHKLCPKISPKKSIEGAIGGMLGSAILCGTFAYFAIPEYFVIAIIIGIVASPISQVGDLSASIIKRKVGIKDYGNLIPGHGGVLDRIDSILITAPTVFYLLYIYVNLVK